MSSSVNPVKKIDLPPRGGRNADPITDEPGAHPIETGIGAASAGAAGGLAAGAMGGPVAAAVGVAVGAVAGGYAGKSVGEMIDPTIDDNWLREHFKSRSYVEMGDEYEDFRSAYRYGALMESRYGDAGLDLTDEKVQQEWDAAEDSDMPWSRASGAVKDGYDRTVQIRKEGGCGTDESDASDAQPEKGDFGP
jgi:hypothetical protein